MVMVGDEGLTEAPDQVGFEAKPVPERGAVWGESVPLSVTVRVPVLAPAAEGLNETVMVQEEFAASVEPQSLVSEKSPDAVIEVMFPLTAPELESVTACVLAPPMGVEGKETEEGFRLKEGVRTGPPPPPLFPLTA